MVYEKKCAVCDKMIDFGGEDKGRLPENAIEFDGEIYCQECVEDFVKFGIGDVQDKIANLEEELKRVKDQLGIEKHA